MQVTMTTQQLSPALIEAMSIGSLPDVEWKQGDDLCDCTYQRLGSWTNPYIGETLEVRWCCIWAELGKQFPEFVRTVPASYDHNQERWITQTRAWDGEAEMPKAIWYRHLARKLDRPLSEIRAEYSQKDHLRPKGRGESVPLWVELSGEWRCINLASRRSA